MGGENFGQGCKLFSRLAREQKPDLVIANKWPMHIKDVYRLHQDELEAIDPKKKTDRLIELSIIEQVYRLAHTSIIQSAWKHGHTPSLHGWVYGLHDGLINDLIKLDYTAEIHPIHR